MIAWNGEHRRGQSLHEVGEIAVLLGTAGLHEVAGQKDQVRTVWRRPKRGKGMRREGIGVHHAIGEPTGLTHVQVAQLCDQHGITCYCRVRFSGAKPSARAASP